MPAAIGFDVYGTLIDVGVTAIHLEALVGERGKPLADVWRRKQLEYAFRRAVMGRYETFATCSKQAFEAALAELDIQLSPTDHRLVFVGQNSLPAFPGVVPDLETLRERGHRLVAFSNGEEATTRALLSQARVLPYLDDVVSVDDLRTFKPDPRTYTYLASRLGRPVGETWLVSSNPWDVIGAKSAGLQAAWLRRDPSIVFDPFGIEPDRVVEQLEDLADLDERTGPS